jgi:dTDP-4-dehydrorhamnose 3,5-epimerase
MPEVASTPIGGLLVITPRVYTDDRGWFFESFNQQSFAGAVGGAQRFLQDNFSRSLRGVLRGLHYQLPPKSQGKLVQVTRGAVFDVAVDIRKSSVTFGEWFATELSDENHRQLWVPPGFAHGFLALSENVDLAYKVTEYYSPEHDRGIRWDDPDIGIDWPDIGIDPLLSLKDADAPLLRDAETFE